MLRNLLILTALVAYCLCQDATTTQSIESTTSNRDDTPPQTTHTSTQESTTGVQLSAEQSTLAGPTESQPNVVTEVSVGDPVEVSTQAYTEITTLNSSMDGETKNKSDVHLSEETAGAEYPETPVYPEKKEPLYDHQTTVGKKPSTSDGPRRICRPPPKFSNELTTKNPGGKLIGKNSKGTSTKGTRKPKIKNTMKPHHIVKGEKSGKPKGGNKTTKTTKKPSGIKQQGVAPKQY